MASPKIPSASAGKASGEEGPDETKAKADQPGGSEGCSNPAASGAAGARESASWIFGFKALVTTVGGGLLTLGITLAQISYSTHLAVLQRQGEQGVEFQNALAEITGRIENEFNDIIDLESSRDLVPMRQAERRLDTNLNDLFRRWRLSRLNLRSRAAQIYGPEVGNLIYNPDEEMIKLDKCYVATRIDDPARDQDCAARSRREGFRLAALVRVSRLRPRDHVLANVRWAPHSFQANARLLRAVFQNYVKCRVEIAEHPRPRADWPEPCKLIEDMERIVTSRLDLMAISREEISTAIMERSERD